MLPYLTNPEQPSIRSINFTQIGLNLQLDGGLNGPCNFGTSCSHIPVSKSVCEDNGGVWWGAGATDPSTAGIPPEGLTYCCDVDIWLANHGQPTVEILPQAAEAIRNEHYKLVRNSTKDYDPSTNACVDTQTTEFYEINENIPVPKIDLAGDNLLDGRALTSTQKRMYVSLLTQLNAIDGSAGTVQRRWQSRPHGRHRGRDRLGAIQHGERREVELVRPQSGWPDRRGRSGHHQ